MYTKNFKITHYFNFIIIMLIINDTVRENFEDFTVVSHART